MLGVEEQEVEAAACEQHGGVDVRPSARSDGGLACLQDILDCVHGVRTPSGTGFKMPHQHLGMPPGCQDHRAAARTAAGFPIRQLTDVLPCKLQKYLPGKRGSGRCKEPL